MIGLSIRKFLSLGQAKSKKYLPYDKVFLSLTQIFYPKRRLKNQIIPISLNNFPRKKYKAIKNFKRASATPRRKLSLKIITA